MQKYSNYKGQMSRLKRAMDHEFLLEALFIEYAIVEDRCESLLLHSGKKVNPRATLSQKLKEIGKLSNKPDCCMNRYVTPKLIDEISEWSFKRNDFIHHLMTQRFSKEELEQIVLDGRDITKTLCSKTTSYKRALEREQKRLEGKIK